MGSFHGKKQNKTGQFFPQTEPIKLKQDGCILRERRNTEPQLFERCDPGVSALQPLGFTSQLLKDDV